MLASHLHNSLAMVYHFNLINYPLFSNYANKLSVSSMWTGFLNKVTGLATVFPKQIYDLVLDFPNKVTI